MVNFPHTVPVLTVISWFASIPAVTLWTAIKQVQKSAMETGVSFKDYGKPRLVNIYANAVESLHCGYLGEA